VGNVIAIDDERIKSHLDRVVRGTVDETLTALLEADRLCNAQRCERSESRRDTRAGHYERNLQTKAGEVRLRVPKLRRQTFETQTSPACRRSPRWRWPTGPSRPSPRSSGSGIGSRIPVASARWNGDHLFSPLFRAAGTSRRQ